MTVFEQRRREAALQRTSHPSDLLTGSKMSGVDAFIVVGPVVGVVGLGLVVLGVRRRGRSKRRQV